MSTAAAETSCLRRRVGVSLALAAVGVGASASAAAADDYVVQPGDTVSHIALRSHTTVRQIVAANGLDARATILGTTPDQITLQVPAVAPGPVSVRVLRNCGTPDELKSTSAPTMKLATPAAVRAP